MSLLDRLASHLQQSVMDGLVHSRVIRLLLLESTMDVPDHSQVTLLFLPTGEPGHSRSRLLDILKLVDRLFPVYRVFPMDDQDLLSTLDEKCRSHHLQLNLQSEGDQARIMLGQISK